MFATPRVEEVQQLARSIGVELDDEQAALFQGIIVARLEEIDAFVQDRLPEDRPPLRYPARKPGYRPTAEEDPYNAWLWRCDIGGGEGLLAGKTVSFKDHIAVAGIPLTFGSFVFEGFIPDFDATVATRVLDAGGRIVGKNTLRGPFGGRITAEAPSIGDYWRPRNPHSAAHTTGGSSSGCAAAVAAGEVDVAIGGDRRGSIRIPSASCGLVGLKPTFGLVPHTGAAFGTDQSVDHVGPIARSVEDVARALEAIAGYDDYDPRQGRLVPERIDALTTLADGVAGLRIGLLEEGFDEPIEEDVRDRVLEAVEVLGKAGAEIVPVSVPEHRTIEAPLVTGLQTEGALAIRDTTAFGMWAGGYYPTSVIVAWSKLFANEMGRVQPATVLDHLIGRFSRQNFHGAPYAKAQNVRPHFVHAYDRALTDVDLLAMPTLRSVAQPVKDPPKSRQEAFRQNIGKASGSGVISYNTSPFDYTGHPALAVPCGMGRGMPTSLQLVGRFFDEALLLRTAFAFHEAAGWNFSL